MVGSNRPVPQGTSLYSLLSSSLHYNNLRTDREVADFEISTGPLLLQALRGTWDIENYLDNILVEHRFIVRLIPRALTRLWGEALLLATRLVRDHPKEHRAWAIYMALPFLCLQTSQGYRSQGPRMQEMRACLVRFIRGDLQALYWEAIELHQANRQRRMAKEACDLEQELEHPHLKQGWTRQAAQLVKEGRLAAALEEMEKNGGDIHRRCTDAAEREKQASAAWMEREQAAAAQGALQYTLTVEEVKRQIQRKNPASAAGFSGIRIGHIHTALRNEGTQGEMYEVMTGVANIIIQGKIPLLLIPYTLWGLGNIAGHQHLFVAMEMIVCIAAADVLPQGQGAKQPV